MQIQRILSDSCGARLLRGLAVRPYPLPGILLRAQGGRWNKDFQVLYQETNKQTAKFDGSSPKQNSQT